MKGVAALFGIFFAINILAGRGEVDTSFIPRLTTNHIIYCVAEQPDGKLLVGGAFEDGYARRKRAYGFLVRLNADGRLDRRFRVSWRGKSNSGRVTAIQFRNDGKIGILGSFTSIDHVAFPGTAALRLDGRADADYHPEDSIRAAAAIAPDGTVFYEASGLPRYVTYASLAPDGRTNSSRSSLPRWWKIAALITLSDGNVVGIGYDQARSGQHEYLGLSYGHPIWGWAVNAERGLSNTTYFCGNFGIALSATNSRSGIVRLAPRIGVDPSFLFTYPGRATNESWTVGGIAVDEDGHVIYAAQVQDRDGTMTGRVGRVDTTGAADETFDSGAGPNGPARGVRRLRNGQLIVWGSFTSFDGVPRPGIVRLLNQ